MMTDDDTLASHLLSLLSPANQAKYPLHLAVVQSDKNRVRKLLKKKKTSVDCLYKGVTPLCWAITKGDIEVINLLLQHKAFINLLDDVGRTPLMWAAQMNSPDVVQLLVEHGAKINVQDTGSGTALIFAAQNENENSTGLVEVLVKHGAQVNIKNCFGATALDYAVKANNLGMAELLVKYGAMINVPNGAGVTPMMVAAHMSGSEVVQVLLANGAQIDFQNKAGLTPLICAVDASSLNVVRILVEAGADVHLKDDRGRTALDWATEPPHKGDVNGEIVRILSDSVKKVKKPKKPVVEAATSVNVDGFKEDPDIADVLNFLANNRPESYQMMKKKISIHALKCDVVKLGAPGVARESTKYEWFTCFHCKANERDVPPILFLKKCVKCKVARYCVVNCQRKDWPDHKKWCKDVVSYRSSIVDLEASKLRRKAADLSISETKESDETSKVSEESNETARDLPKKEGKKSKGKCCLYCHKVKSAGHPIRQCICKAVRYCSQECHEKDWENHKQHCLEIRAREKDDDNTEEKDARNVFDIDDVD